MTVKELRKYRAICVELDQIKEKLSGSKIHVKDAVQSASKHPYSLHSVTIEGDVYENSNPALYGKRQYLINEKHKIEQFINAIPDYKVRRALEIYCLEPLGADMDVPNWEKVADIMGDGSTGSSLKMLVSRYFQKI